MRILYSLLLAFGVLALSGFAFIHSGIYDVTATEEHSAIGKWALHTTMKKSVEARASDLAVPRNLSSQEMVRQGARAYDQLCAACHLKPGQNNTLIRQGLNPMPPALTKAGHFGPAEQFWVIKNGIKMTGMPAWGSTHADQDLWEITAFVQQLPKLSEQQYASLLQPEAGAEIADDGHAHDHGDMGGMMATESSHSEPAHHASEEGSSDHHANDSGHHAKEVQKEDARKAQDDHYADGHTH